MTIRKGEEWGRRAPTPPGTIVLGSDHAVHDWVVDHRERGEQVPSFGLGGGDLARTVSGGSHVGELAECTMLPLDLVRVDAGGRTTWSVAHVVCRRSWWTGDVVFAMTAEFLGDADVAPRAHPNDGRIDVLRVAASMSPRTRWQARRRSRTGSHLPHPDLSVERVTSVALVFSRPLVVWVDGRRWTTTDRLTLSVEPDAYTAYV